MLKTLTRLRDYWSNSAEAIFFFNFKKYSPETVMLFFFFLRMLSQTGKNIFLDYSSKLFPKHPKTGEHIKVNKDFRTDLVNQTVHFVL